MSPHLLKVIHQKITKLAPTIQDQLPPLPGHPRREARTHLYTEIKYRFGMQAKDIPTNRFDDVMRVIDICVEHADDPNLCKYLDWVVPEKITTLDDLFE